MDAQPDYQGFNIGILAGKEERVRGVGVISVVTSSVSKHAG